MIQLVRAVITAKIEVYRGYRRNNFFKVLVGKHEGKIVDLLENG
jgi:hypothetical protein